MLKNSFALDLDYNCYVVNSDFVRYILPEEEINSILENKCSGDKEDNGKVILYDYKFLYFAPGDFIDKFKLSKGDKVNLLNDVGNIKISEITSENIRAISFLLHYAPFLMNDDEEAEVVAYEAPMSVLYQRFPLSQRMFYFTEEAQSRKDDVDRSEGKLKEKISFDTRDKVSLSGDGSQGAGEDKSLNSLYEGLNDFGMGDSFKSQSKNAEQNKKQETGFDWPIGPDGDECLMPPPTPEEKVSDRLPFIKDAAQKTGIDEKLLFGILVSEQKRYDWKDALGDMEPFDIKIGETKGLAQISADSALEGEIYFRNHNNNPDDNFVDNEENRNNLRDEIRENIFSDEKNIEYAAKYINFLENELFSKEDIKNLSKEKRDELIAAAYKAGPEAVKNARMQEQLNDLLIDKLDKESLQKLFGDKEKMATDGDPGGTTRSAIVALIDSYGDDPVLQGKIKDLINNSYGNDYERVRAVINELWEAHHPGRDNPPGAVPIYENNDARGEGRVDLHVQDVLEAEKYYEEHGY